MRRRIMLLAVLAIALWFPSEGYAETLAEPSDVLRRVYDKLKAADPEGQLLKDGMYSLTYGNTLPQDWLLDTPHVWGTNASAVPVANRCGELCNHDFQLNRCPDAHFCTGGTRCVIFPATNEGSASAESLCVGHSDELVNHFYLAIANAQQYVDIMTLQGVPTGRFLAAFRNAVTYLASTGRSVTIRIVFGQYPPNASLHTSKFLEDLTSVARTIRGSNLKIYVAAQNTKHYVSWNHSKVVAVDGNFVVEGGHNLHDEIYLRERPVFDLSMKVSGPAAVTAHRFANKIWDFVCKNNKHGRPGWLTYSNSWVADPVNPGKAKIEKGCLSTISLPADPVRTDGIPILAVASPGWGLEDKAIDPSDMALQDLLSNAKDSIYISQMDLGFRYKAGGYHWPWATMRAIGSFIINQKKDVYIVLSEPGARSADGKVEFSWDAPLPWAAEEIFKEAQKVPGAPVKKELATLLCEKLHIAPIRFGKDSKWTGGKAIGNHAKTYIIDENVFYIGSHNMYPTKFGNDEGRLQEFGYIVGSKTATSELKKNYWSQLWEHSKKDAVIGNGGTCILSGK